MTEYVERDAVKKMLCRYCSDIAPENCDLKDECNVVCRIDAIDAADVRPVVKARWTRQAIILGHPLELFLCPACGGPAFQATPFCPTCGAQMEGQR